MKNSAILASALFGALSLAAPVVKRDLATKTQLVVETVVVFTTVYNDDVQPAAQATSTAGGFYEQSSQAVVPSSVYTPPAVSSSVYTPPAASSSAYVAPVVSSTPTPTPSSVVVPSSSVYTPPASSAAASSSVYTPPASSAVVPSSVYTPAASSSVAAAAASSAAPATGSTGSGTTYSDVDITVYDNTGAPGACGTAITDGDYIAAVAKGTWGASTYNVQTGASTNPWCGKKITVELNGRTIQATIQDECAGCNGSEDIDLTRAAFNDLTGSTETTRYHGAKWYAS